MRVLIIEDDKSVALNIVRGLAEHNIHSDTANDGEKGLAMIRQDQYDVLIVDRMLPKVDGLELIKIIRTDKITTPALMLTALGEIDDKVEGLDAGADDYMAKPFAFVELLARIKALTKRNTANTQETIITIGTLYIDKVKRIVTRKDKAILLQPREFDLLAYLAEKKGETVTRQMLLEKVWGFEFNPQTNIVEVHISRLRNKVDKGFRDPMIHTIRGIGYRLATEKYII